ncbi:MAG TPA: HNH endonuclease signature motif containing protein [Acidimicrobiales bacterium]|jgi:hypothetical protein
MDRGAVVLDNVRGLVDGIGRVVAALPDVLRDPTFDVEEAAALVQAFDQLGRLATVGTTLSARHAQQLEAHELTGHRNATDWLAQTAGLPFNRAKEMLELPGSLERSPEALNAFTQGQVSFPQAQLIGDAVSVTPESGPRLVEEAKRRTHRQLAQEVERVKQVARSQEEDRERRARAHARRALRWSRLPEGGIRVQLYLTEEAWARCLPNLKQRANELFRLGRSAKVRSTQEQYMADACVDLLSGAIRRPGADTDEAAPGNATSTRTSVTCIVRVDAAALRRGRVGEGEICEIAGVGPISVDAAIDLLGEAGFRLLVTDAQDVRAITGRTRYAPARLEAALFERDPVCVVPGCDVSIGLQTHHWRRDFALGGPTELDNLCRICAIHHGLTTSGGWKLIGGPGKWQWMPPDWRVSKDLRDRRRQVNASRAKRRRAHSAQGRSGSD